MSLRGTRLKPIGWSLHRRLRALSLTATLFPVPRSPIISTPPIAGSMTLRMSASFISSCPTIFTCHGQTSSCEVHIRP